MEFYDLLINNCVSYLHSDKTKQALAKLDMENVVDAFTMSEVLAIALCKSKEDIFADIINKGNCNK